MYTVLVSIVLPKDKGGFDKECLAMTKENLFCFEKRSRVATRSVFWFFGCSLLFKVCFCVVTVS